MDGTCQNKGVLLKKWGRRIRNGRTRLLQAERAFHRRYFSLRVNNQDFMEPEQTKSKCFVIEPSVVMAPKTSGNYRVNISGKRDHQVYTHSLQYHPQGLGQWKEIWRPGGRTRLWKKFSSQEKYELLGGRRKNIKNDDPHRNEDFI